MTDYSGSFSGSFEGTFLGGVISSSAQLSIGWNSGIITDRPTTIQPFQANSIISNNRFREITYPAISASTSTRFTTIEANVSTLSGQIQAAVSGTVPPGTISGSPQIADLGYLTSASAANLGFGSGGGGGVSDFTQLTNIPVGLVSGAAQVASLLPVGVISSSAQIPIRTFTVTNSGASAYLIDGVSNATITLIRGFTYNFNVNASGHPFWIQTVAGAYSSGNIYSTGVTNGGAAVGTITFTVPYNAPNTLYYVCQVHSSMAGIINIKDAQGEIYTAGLGIIISDNVITLNTSSNHFIQGVSASAAASGFGGGGGSNTAPTIANQSMSAVPESSSAGYEVGLIAATDVEGNVITFGAFTISNVFLNSNPSVNLTSSLGGTSLFDPSIDPFQANSSGVITRKNGVFLNADVADRYVYLATATDAFSTATGSGLITIPISQHQLSSIGGNGETYYIIESAVQGVNLTTNPNGYSAGNVTFSSAVSQMWEVNTNPSGYVRFTNGNTHLTGSSVILEVDTDISGNLSFGQTIDIQITASQTSFETTKQYRNHTLNITENKPYLVGFSNTSDNLNTNGARPSNTLTTISFTEQQAGVGDTLNHNSFTFTNSSGQLTASRSGDTYLVSALTNLSGSTSYNFTASIRDSYGNIGTNSHSINILQAGTGTLTSGSMFVIESAVSGNLIYTNTNGRAGTQSDLNVLYSPQYNSAAVQSFTSSNAMIHVKSNGNLSVAQNVSGSAFTFDAGNPITSNITWRDQFGNVGGPTQISVNVAINNAPFVNPIGGDLPLSDNWNTNLGVAGVQLATLTWSDTEGDALNVGSFSLSGAGASLLSSSYNGSNVFKITALNDLNAGTINYTASIKDIHGFRTGTYNDSFVIAQAGGGSIISENFYIIESALSGAVVTNDPDGLGSQANVNVLYSPSYGGQSAQGFNSNDSVIAITSTGNLSVKSDISGAYTNGNTIQPTIYWVDQYGNAGTGSITIDVTDNQNPSAVFTNATLTAPVTTNTTLVTVTLTDPEGATPFSMSLSGLSTISMSAVPQNAASSSYLLKNTVEINDAVVLSYTASIFDDWNNQFDYPRTLTIGAPVAADPSVFVYASSRGATQFTLPSQYNTALGDGTVAGRPLYEWKYGYLGTETRTLIGTDDGGTPKMQLIFSGSGTDLVSIMSSSGNLSVQENSGISTAKLIYIVYPSSSDLSSRPLSTGQSFGDSTFGKYLIWYDAGGADEGIVGSQLTNFTLDSSYGYTGSDGTLYAAGQSYQTWTVMGVNSTKFVQSTSKFFVVPTSGSDPTP